VQQYESRIKDKKIKKGSILPIIIDNDNKPNGFWKKVGFSVSLLLIVASILTTLRTKAKTSA
jgi:hypothetical protein